MSGFRGSLCTLHLLQMDVVIGHHNIIFKKNKATYFD